MEEKVWTLRELLERKLMSPAEFGRAIGVSRSAVWHWLDGHNRVKRDHKRLICEFFGFVGDDGFPEPWRIVWPGETDDV